MRLFSSIIGFVLFAAAGLVGCESGGDGQKRRDAPQSRASGSQPSQPETSSQQASQLLSHPEPKEGRDRLSAGDVPPADEKLELSEEEWRERLDEKEFKILREWGTEPAHSGDLLEVDARGIYYCAGCGNPVFSSKHKFESGSGWPSFTRPYHPKRVGLQADDSLGMVRTEVHCARCGGHLGHVFDDGPPPTGKRYCLNSLALEFKSVDAIRADSSDAPDGVAEDPPSE